MGIEMLRRLENWPEKLAEQIALAQNTPYQIGVHDCLRLSCKVIEAMTGKDYWPQFAGYTPRREAVAKLAEYGDSLEAAAAAVLGVTPSPRFSASRGDLLIVKDKYGEHLGVCTGSSVAVLEHSGLLMLRLDHSAVGNCLKVGA